MPFIVAVAAFIAVMVETIIIQQRCVDAVKRMNPEKTASVYDVKFQRKWMDSCNEAEKLMIGKCAYKAYAAANTACAGNNICRVRAYIQHWIPAIACGVRDLVCTPVHILQGNDKIFQGRKQDILI